MDINTTETQGSSRNVLVTGGLGFIGFNALKLWKQLRPSWKIVVADNETYAAQFKLKEKKEWCKDNGIDLECIDISDPFFYQLPAKDHANYLEHIVQVSHIDTIINFAAESHVDNSISSPEVFFKTNINGTVNLLETARKHHLRYHQVSTDEVYGETTPDSWKYDYYDLASDMMPLKPSSPYSASKASADLITLSYVRTYGLNATISRCCNNFGPWQHPEKLIPTVCSRLKEGKKIPVYGDGQQKRQWIYVDDHNCALLDVIENGKAGHIYTISTQHAGYMTNLELIEKLCKAAGATLEDAIEHVKDRPGHDTTYFLYSYNGVISREALYARVCSQLEDTAKWFMENL